MPHGCGEIGYQKLCDCSDGQHHNAYIGISFSEPVMPTQFNEVQTFSIIDMVDQHTQIETGCHIGSVARFRAESFVGFLKRGEGK